MGDDYLKQLKVLVQLVFMLGVTVVLLMGAVLLFQHNPNIFVSQKEDSPVPSLEEGQADLVKDGVHVATGLVAEDGYETVIANCTNCHAADLITQNRGTEERWMELIDWMQETQGLWDLGSNEEIIVAYLSKYYAPVQRGRRANLENIEWYDLEE
ncbi:hypothetical protein GCM10028791_14010 [Echinicola sediminis]